MAVDNIGLQQPDEIGEICRTINKSDTPGLTHVPVSMIDIGDGITESLITAANPMPITAPPSLPLPAGAATEATVAALLAKVLAAPSTEAKQDAIITLLNTLATQATSAAILAKIIAAPATEAKQLADNHQVTVSNPPTGYSTTSNDNSIATALLMALSTIAGQQLPNSHDVTVDNQISGFATEVTAASILAKIIAAPATEAKQDVHTSALGTLATQTTAAAILAKLIAAPATEAKQLPDNHQVTVSNTVAVTQSGAATEAKQDTGNTSLATIAAKDFATSAKQDTQTTALGTLATQVTAAAILAKLIAAPATEAKQDTQITHESNIATAVQVMDDWDESDRAKVNLIVGQAGVTAGAGNADAGTQRVIAANNDPGVTYLFSIDASMATLAATAGIVSALPAVNFADVMVTGQGSQTTINRNVILAVAGTGSYDCHGTSGITYRSFSIQIVAASGTFTAGVITFEGSNDDTNWNPIFLRDAASVTSDPVSSYTPATSTTRYFVGEIPFRYVRARISTGVTGTTTGVQAFTKFSTVPYSSSRLTVTQATTTGLNAAVVMGPGPTTAPKQRDQSAGVSDVGMPAFFVRRDTPTAVTPAAGDYEFGQISANGEQWVRMAGELADDANFTVGTTRVLPVGLLADESSTDSVDEGDVGIARMTLDRKAVIAQYAHTAGGATPFFSLDLDESEEDVKTSAGQVYGFIVFNMSASVRYLKFYNATAANTTVGSTTPHFTVPIPTLATTNGAGMVVMLGTGIEFTTAICVAATTGFANNDTGSPGTNEIFIVVLYK